MQNDELSLTVKADMNAAVSGNVERLAKNNRLSCCKSEHVCGCVRLKKNAGSCPPVKAGAGVSM